MKSRSMKPRKLTENDSFLPSLLINQTIENKIELTDVSYIEISEARPKTPAIKNYSSSPKFDFGKREFVVTEGNEGSLVTPSDHHSSKQILNYESWDQGGFHVKSSFLPRDNETFSTSAQQPKLMDKLNKLTERHDLHVISNKIPQSPLSRSGEIASEFSSGSPSQSPKSSKNNSFHSSESDSNPSSQPGELPDTLPKPNPARQHRKSISLPQKVQNALIAHKLIPSKSKDTSDPIIAELAKQEPRKVHSFKRSWFKSSLSIRFRPNDLQKQALPQALAIINDKATLVNSHEKNSQQGIRNPTYRLVKILKKHSQEGGLSNGGTQLFNFIAGLKKREKRTH